jgi:hypothetical protein
MVICCGVGAGGVWPGGAPGIEANSLILVTPPMKKLPWSAMVTGPPVKRFCGVWADTPAVSAAAAAKPATANETKR